MQQDRKQTEKQQNMQWSHKSTGGPSVWCGKDKLLETGTEQNECTNRPQAEADIGM